MSSLWHRKLQHFFRNNIIPIRLSTTSLFTYVLCFWFCVTSFSAKVTPHCPCSEAVYFHSVQLLLISILPLNPHKFSSWNQKPPAHAPAYAVLHWKCFTSQLTLSFLLISAIFLQIPPPYHHFLYIIKALLALKLFSPSHLVGS